MRATSLPKKGVLVLIADQKHIGVTNLPVPLNPLSLTWTLLDSPGLSLRNSLNKCWFHSTLHLLTNIPSLRALCSSKNAGYFEKRFLAALMAIFSTRRQML